MTSTQARVRLAELNKQAEDPDFWNDQQRAQRLMQERTALEDQLDGDRPHRAGARRPAHHDRARRGREGPQGHRRRRRGAQEAQGRGGAARARGAACRARPTPTTAISRSMPAPAAPRARTGPTCCCACTRAGPSSTATRSSISKRPPGEEAGIKSATIAGQGPQRLWLAQDRGRRAPAGAHLAVRLQRPPPYLVRQRQRLSGDRRPHRHGHQGSRRAHRHLALERGRGPARQQDRIGGPPHPHPDQHRRVLPERPLAAQEPRRRPGRCCARGSTRWS